VPNSFGYLLDFVDAGENFVMADDVVTPSDFLVAPIEKEELEEASLDMNVFQQLCEEEPSKRMVRIRVDRLAWDR